VRAALKVSGNRFAAGLSAGVTIGLAGAALIGSLATALAECRPSHLRAPYFIRTMGRCGFDTETLSFRGTPAQQAMCLMRGMDVTRNLAPMLEGLPSGLAERVGQTTGLPSREALSAYLSKLDLEWDLAMYLWQPISRARDNDPAAPMAKYFVIHDTSGPNYGHRAFPDDINTNLKINNLKRFVCYDEWGKAHAVIDRMGDILINHDFSIPWRETKFEQAAEFGGALKGLFVHTEMIQPRRAGRHGGDSQSPDPAFTSVQYDRLALVYTVASVRAGRWLIPAFHAALDADIRNGHDDPLNFKVDSFANSIDQLNEQLQGGGQPQASNAASASGTEPDASSAASGGFWVDALWGTPHKAAPAVASSAGEDNPPALDGLAATDNPTTPQPDMGAAPASGGPAASAPAVQSAPANVATPPASPTIIADKPRAREAAPHVAASHEPVTHQPALHRPAAHQPVAREKVAERESEPLHNEKSTEVCTTHGVKGHLGHACEPASAAAQEHGKEHGMEHGMGADRSVERETSPRSEARHHGAAPHQHHDAGASPRHRRS
jgi:hypothetical protein